MDTPSRKPPEEGFLQADYDMDTAGSMFRECRYFYAVFMCHLSIEKTLKGLFLARTEKEPPRIHNLLYFVDELQLELPPDLDAFLMRLNGLSIPTRYPDELRRMTREYDRARTEAVIEQSRKALEWLKSLSQ
jgi:HEPN domain-containing protein